MKPKLLIVELWGLGDLAIATPLVAALLIALGLPKRFSTKLAAAAFIVPMLVALWLWKEFPADGVEAVLTISGMGVGYPDTVPVVLEKLEFARAGAIQRGSYVYDDLKVNDRRAIKLGDVGAVVYSEAVGDVQTFMAAGSYDPDWRKRR